MTPFAAHRRDLAALAERDRYRRLHPRAGIDFASNDYLGLAGSPRLRDAVAEAIGRGAAIGSGGSRLLRGNDPEHEALEAEAASFFGAESALYFSSGFAANATLLATLPQRGDLIVHDALIHASAHDGMALARAPRVIARHNDAQSFADTIANWRAGGGMGTPWIVVESLYSMDGDRAPLDALAAVADRYDAVLIVDEAHATGVFGPEGRGLLGVRPRGERVVSLHTCGKALGCEGALVCGPRVVTDFLINRGRGFIFSTAPSPLMAAAVREALHILSDEPELRTALVERIATAERLLSPLGATATGSQILPVVLGEDAQAMRVAAALQAAGLDVRGIRPPTVPAGTARLRISLTLNVDTSDIERLADTLEEVLR